MPVGYVYDTCGQTVMDPDEEVLMAVRNVFESFKASGSAYGAVSYFAQKALRFPKRAYGGAWDGKLVWGPLIHSRVVGILNNPCYAGAYVYGRYRDQKKVSPEGLFVHHIVCLPKDKWEVFIPDHHPGYISWEMYELNQKQLQDNRTNLQRSGPAREGIALLQGLLICGKCGRRMTVRYTGNGGISPVYECKGRWRDGQEATCTTVPAPPLDKAVSMRLMEVMQPAELELAIEVMDKLLKEEDDTDKGWKLAIERAKYEAERAQRQYQLVEPENRLVARSLESRWNEKLAELSRIEKEYKEFRLKESWRPTEKDKSMILALAKDLPRIWDAPTTTAKEKKRILRLVIEDVTVFAKARVAEVRLGIRWKSNLSEQIHTTKPLPNQIARKHTAETVELVRKLSAAMTDRKVAAHLNESGHRTPEGREFSIDSIKWIRYKHNIKGLYRMRKGLTVKEVAEKFGVSPSIVYYWIEREIIEAKKVVPGWPWDIQLDKHKEEELLKRVSKSKHLSKSQNSVGRCAV